jgi:hypothetical protein
MSLLQKNRVSLFVHVTHDKFRGGVRYETGGNARVFNTNLFRKNRMRRASYLALCSFGGATWARPLEPGRGARGPRRCALPPVFRERCDFRELYINMQLSLRYRRVWRYWPSSWTAATSAAPLRPVLPLRSFHLPLRHKLLIHVLESTSSGIRRY